MASKLFQQYALPVLSSPAYQTKSYNEQLVESKNVFSRYKAGGGTKESFVQDLDEFYNVQEAPLPELKSSQDVMQFKKLLDSLPGWQDAPNSVRDEVKSELGVTREAFQKKKARELEGYGLEVPETGPIDVEFKSKYGATSPITTPLLEGTRALIRAPFQLPGQLAEIGGELSKGLTGYGDLAIQSGQQAQNLFEDPLKFPGMAIEGYGQLAKELTGYGDLPISMGQRAQKMVAPVDITDPAMGDWTRGFTSLAEPLGSGIGSSLSMVKAGVPAGKVLGPALKKLAGVVPGGQKAMTALKPGFEKFLTPGKTVTDLGGDLAGAMAVSSALQTKEALEALRSNPATKDMNAWNAVPMGVLTGMIDAPLEMLLQGKLKLPELPASLKNLLPKVNWTPAKIAALSGYEGMEEGAQKLGTEMTPYLAQGKTPSWKEFSDILTEKVAPEAMGGMLAGPFLGAGHLFRNKNDRSAPSTPPTTPSQTPGTPIVPPTITPELFVQGKEAVKDLETWADFRAANLEGPAQAAGVDLNPEHARFLYEALQAAQNPNDFQAAVGAIYKQMEVQNDNQDPQGIPSPGRTGQNSESTEPIQSPGGETQAGDGVPQVSGTEAGLVPPPLPTPKTPSTLAEVEAQLNIHRNKWLGLKQTADNTADPAQRKAIENEMNQLKKISVDLMAAHNKANPPVKPAVEKRPTKIAPGETIGDLSQHTPILNLVRIRGIKPKAQAQKEGKIIAGEYDNTDGIGRGVFKKDGESPDLMAQMLANQGLIPEPSADLMFEAIRGEQRAAKNLRDNAKIQGADNIAEFERQKYWEQNESEPVGEADIATYGVGDTFSIQGVKHRVTRKSPDSLFVHDGTKEYDFYPGLIDKGSFRQATSKMGKLTPAQELAQLLDNISPDFQPEYSKIERELAESGRDIGQISEMKRFGAMPVDLPTGLKDASKVNYARKQAERLLEHGEQEVQDVVLGFAEQQNLGAINGKYGEGVGTMARKQFALEMRKAMGAIRENASFTDLFSRGGPKIEFQVKAKGLDPGLKDRVSNAIAEANRNYQEWASNTEAKDISTGQMGRISDVVNKKNLQNTGTRIHYSIEQDRENEPVTSIYEKLDQNLKAQEGERYGFSSLPTDKQDSLRPIIERAKTGGIEALLPDMGGIPAGTRGESGPSNRRTSQGLGGEDIQFHSATPTESVPTTEQLAILAKIPKEDIDYLKKEVIDIPHAFGLTDSRNHIESELVYNHIAEIARKNKTPFLAIFGDQKMVGSLSEILSPELADQIYARLNKQLTEELAKYIGNGRGFIIGGDEQARYYFANPAEGEKHLRKVLEDVDRRIQVAKLDKLPNFKTPDKPETWGVGFYFKTFAIDGSKTYDQFLKEMGVAIELEKKAVSEKSVVPENKPRRTGIIGEFLDTLEKLAVIAPKALKPDLDEKVEPVFSPKSDQAKEKLSQKEPVVESPAVKREQLKIKEPGLTPSEVSTENEKRKTFNSHVSKKLDNDEDITWRELFSWSNDLFGGTQAEAKYTPKDAYDAMELAVNQNILEKKMTPDGDASLALKKLKALRTRISHLPTQTKRTAEMDEFQQFSTPPTIAFVANWLANINQDDTMLEPSAGVGGLAIFAHNAGAEVIVNELSARRRALLESLPFQKIFGENAEILDAMPKLKSVKPTVVVMNPPFSATAGRMEGKRDNAIGMRHIQAALNMLAPDGRLVAIVGEGQHIEAPSTKKQWDRIKEKNHIVADIGVSGKEYTKYGTTFGNRIIVIDKVSPAGKAETLSGIVESLDEFFSTKEGKFPILIEGVRNARSSSKQIRIEVSTETKETPKGETLPGSGTLRAPSPPGGRGGKQGVVSPAQPTGTSGKEIKSDIQDVLSPDIVEGRPDDSRRPVGTGTDIGRKESERISGVSERLDESPTRSRKLDESKVTSAEEGQSNKDVDSTFQAYVPARVRIEGSKPHPTPLSETTAMASTPAPKPTYSPDLPAKTVENGDLSLPQLEAVVYAGQAHQSIMPDGKRKGFMIGDGTGVGKGREISGIILDNWRQGRKKAIWITKNDGLSNDARRDLLAVTGLKDEVFTLQDYSPIAHKEGVLVMTFGQLSSSQKGESGIPGKSRIDQVKEWIGDDFDGVLVFDEAHLMGNATDSRIGGKKNKASERGKKGLEIQNDLPLARVVYATATAATEVRHLAFAERLGLWGPGTAFKNREDFITKIASGGLAAMEIVSRDMKAAGVYISRGLSMSEVTFDTIEHELTEQQTDVYNRLARMWQVVLQDVERALEINNVGDNGRAKGFARGAFWTSQQRFFQQVLSGMVLPSVFDDMKKKIAAGESVIVQLVNTNEASQDRQLGATKDTMTEEEKAESLDLSPKEILGNYLNKSFPTQLFEDYTDDNGNTQTRPVYDSEGNPIENPDAVVMRDNLLSDLSSLPVPENPLDQIVNFIGPDKIAEVTGRKRRVVMGEDGRKSIQKRSKAIVNQDIKDFEDDQKPNLVFSGAGGTGKTFSSSREFKNQRKRNHYVIQAGWSAQEAVQGFGRSHRSNQANSPTFILTTTNVSGSKRFTSAIAARLAQLGAISKGERKSEGGGMFKEFDNLDNQYAKDAVRTVITSASMGGIPGFESADSLQDKMGLDSRGETSVTRFLNRVLSLELGDQETMFNRFFNSFISNVDAAKASGNYDDGLQNIKALNVEEISETVVNVSDTGAETIFFELEVELPTQRTSWESLSESFKTRVVYDTHNEVLISVGTFPVSQTLEDGSIQELVRATPSVGTPYWIEKNSYRDKQRFTRFTEEEREAKWNEEYEKAPKSFKTPIHIITGALLPVYDKLPGRASIVRVRTDKGSYVGRMIEPRDLSTTMKNLGLGDVDQKKVAAMTPAEVVKSVLSGASVKLSNNLQIKRAVVSGEQRIEVSGLDFYSQKPFLDAGGFKERISWNDRYFAPISPEVAEKALSAVMLNQKVTGVFSPPSPVNNQRGGRISAGQPKYSAKKLTGPAKSLFDELDRSLLAEEEPRFSRKEEKEKNQEKILPYPVFHGSSKSFSSFNSEKASSDGIFWFGKNKNFAKKFGTNITEVQLVTRKPLDLSEATEEYSLALWKSELEDMGIKGIVFDSTLDEDGEYAFNGLLPNRGNDLVGDGNLIERIKLSGYDAILAPDEAVTSGGNPSGPIFVVFNPNQIKPKGTPDTQEVSNPTIEEEKEKNALPEIPRGTDNKLQGTGDRSRGGSTQDTVGKMPGDVGRSDQERLKSLEESLQRYHGYDLAGSLQTVDSGQLSTSNRLIRDVFDAVLGKTVVFFHDNGPKGGLGVNGVTIPGEPDTIYVDVSTKHPGMAVAGHELLHLLKQDNPEIYQSLLKEIGPEVQRFGAFRQKLDRIDPGLDADRAAEELLGDFLGDQMPRDVFWAGLSKKNPTLFQKVADAFRKLFNLLRSFLSRQKGFQSEQFFRDLDKARDAMEKAFVAYAQARQKARAGTARGDFLNILEDILTDQKLTGQRNIKGELSGVDLKVGGEGMKGFYDKILPAELNKYAKAFGVKVGEVNLGDVKTPSKVPGIELTPALREKALAGQPKYSRKIEEVIPKATAEEKKFLDKLKDMAGKVGKGLINTLGPLASEVSEQRADELGIDESKLHLHALKQFFDSERGESQAKMEESLMAAHINAETDRMAKAIIKHTSPGAFRDWLLDKYRRVVYPWHAFAPLQRKLFLIAERVYWDGNKIAPSKGFRIDKTETKKKPDGSEYTVKTFGYQKDVPDKLVMDNYNELPTWAKDALIARAKHNEEFRKNFVENIIPERLKENEKRSTILSAKINKVKADLAELESLRDQDEGTVKAIAEAVRSLEALRSEWGRIQNKIRLDKSNEGHYGYVHHYGYPAEIIGESTDGQPTTAKSGTAEWYEAIPPSWKYRQGTKGYRDTSLLEADLMQRRGETKAEFENKLLQHIEDVYGVSVKMYNLNFDDYREKFGPAGGTKIQSLVDKDPKGNPVELYLPGDIYNTYMNIRRPERDTTIGRRTKETLDAIDSITAPLNEAMLYYPTKFGRDVLSAPIHIAEFIRDYGFRNLNNPMKIATMLPAAWDALTKAFSPYAPEVWRKLPPGKLREFSESLYFQKDRGPGLVTQGLDKLSLAVSNFPLGSTLAQLFRTVNLAGAGDIPLRRFFMILGENLANQEGLAGGRKERFIQGMVSKYGFDTKDLPPTLATMRGLDESSSSKAIGTLSRASFPFFGYPFRAFKSMMVDPFYRGIPGIAKGISELRQSDPNSTSTLLEGASEILRPVLWGALALAAHGFDDDEETAAGNLQSIEGLDYLAKTTGRIRIGTDNKGERWLSSKGYGVAGLANMMTEVILSDKEQALGDITTEVLSLSPHLRIFMAGLGYTNPYDKNLPIKNILAQYLATLVIPQAIRAGPEVSKYLSMLLGDNTIPDRKKLSVVQSLLGQFGVPAKGMTALGTGPVPRRKTTDDEMIEMDPLVEFVKLLGPNIRHIPHSLIAAEAGDALVSLEKKRVKSEKAHAYLSGQWGHGLTDKMAAKKIGISAEMEFRSVLEELDTEIAGMERRIPKSVEDLPPVYRDSLKLRNKKAREQALKLINSVNH